ncbi:CPBP family intramembrane glutamic endopeptidase [Methanobrevibacter filiformis]|uniref:CAAX amino terminal protease self-immunity n=1 Tax=Methanobrevibacter filiformis TaxID=55758 RepID=A0A166CGY5_9EURY|nr:CPBP family intramembrane glutamic endopeptidase [Methanobrevibacter filiformis]KZX14227.1 CAAX amino terminal protease self- immunity [Methanobrevibacter filiformis]
MYNKFLINAKEGKNEWWRYLITIIVTWGIGSFIAGIIMGIILAIYLISTGNLNIEALPDVVNLLENDISLFLFSTFIQSGIMIALFTILVKYIHKRKLMSIINISDKIDALKSVKWIKRIRWMNILKGFVIWVAFSSILLFIDYLMDPTIFSLNTNFGNIYLILLLFIIAIPIQVTFEELFFRGYLNQGLSLIIKKPLIVILISSLFFSLGHIVNGGLDPIFMASNVLTTFVVGIILCIYTITDKGIESAVGIHLGNNFFAILISSSEGSVGNFSTLVKTTTAVDQTTSLIFTVGVYLIFLIILVLYKKEEILKYLGH